MNLFKQSCTRLGVCRKRHSNRAEIIGEQESGGMTTVCGSRVSPHSVDVQALAVADVRLAWKVRRSFGRSRAFHGTCDTWCTRAKVAPFAQSVEERPVGIFRQHGLCQFEHAVVVGMAIRAVQDVPFVKVGAKGRRQCVGRQCWRSSSRIEWCSARLLQLSRCELRRSARCDQGDTGRRRKLPRNGDRRRLRRRNSWLRAVGDSC